MNKPTAVSLAAIIGLSGCATTVTVLDYYDMDSDVLKRIKGMSIVEEQLVLTSEYTDLGIVKGFYCHRNRVVHELADSPVAMRDAIDQLKLRAASKGADRISTPQCVVSENMDLTNNCWASLTCSGHALKITQ